jgi:molybdenum cofactor biosynthesis enzyme MoaA
VSIQTTARRILRPWAARNPGLKRWIVDRAVAMRALEHSAAARVPALIRPRTRNLTVAITANCNLRCEGCRYGRDFMPKQELPLHVVRDMLDDAADAGVDSIRLYGGEPLLHRELPQMVEHGIDAGLGVYVTTNATLLERRIDDLFAAGLRTLTIGFYGTDEAYDAYTGRAGASERVERGVAAVRERYGDSVRLRLNWLLMRPTANDRSLDQVLEFARRYDTPLQVDLVHYSLPYFTEGEEGRLQFRDEDRPAIQNLVKRLVEVKRNEPHLLEHSELGLWSIPDWLLKGAEMRVPCDKYEMLWIGADGSVQLCYVTFPLGNLHEVRLRDILYSDAHVEAARGAFRLDCPNCHCGYDSRTQKHMGSRRRYGGSTAAAPRTSSR